MTTTIEVQKNDVLEVNSIFGWRFSKRVSTRADIKFVKGLLASTNRLCQWRLVRDDVVLMTTAEVTQ